MGRRATQFAQDEYFHIYNRGCNREEIFRSPDNYLFLVDKLKAKTEEFSVAVIAYCLMPNHYHFLLRQDAERAIDQLIQSIFNSYAKAFNTVYRRSGTLFEGPFRSIHIDSARYLVHLCRYIHRNPLDGGLVQNLEAWEYSNYLECICKRNNGLVDRILIREHFSTPKHYAEFVLDYIPPKKLDDELKKYLLE